MKTWQLRRFEKYSQAGRRFILLWNAADRRGIQTKLAAEFNISIAVVYRVRKKLGLPDLHSAIHPGTRKLVRKIIKMYFRHERSTLSIAKSVRMCPENVRRILKSRNVPMHPKHVTNPLYIPFKNNHSRGHITLVKKIKSEYEMGETIAELARRYGFDQGAISKKLKMLHVDIRQNHGLLPGGYPCLWCGNIMEKVWQNRGPRKQKYCDGKCKNKAKDFRRMLKGQKFSQTRMDTMRKFLRTTWKGDAMEQTNKILETVPVVPNVGNVGAR